MQQIVLSRIDGESLEQCLWRLVSLKKTGDTPITWDQIADFLNAEFGFLYDESAYRKKYKHLAKAAAAKQLSAVYDGDFDEKTKQNLRALEKQRIRIREECGLYNKALRTEAQADSILDELKREITAFKPIQHTPSAHSSSDKALCAMLSDVHYGITFNTYGYSYSPDIARQRVMGYADMLISIGQQHAVSDIYVPILGDLVSGNIHQTTKLENRINLVSQVVGVSELIAAFLHQLSLHFAHVYVSGVSGNHSRIEPNPENALRSERLDDLIPWYCKAKLEHIKNVHFQPSQVDPTIDMFQLFGKTYVAVHGDFDTNLKESSVRISELIGKPVDYLLLGHMHVADMRFDRTGYIRNGAVVTGGDDYTTKKRLFGPATQVAMLCSPSGVDAIYPVVLS